MALATKRLLADSLRRLLEKKPLDKITVKEIVENCGVNRQTFYYNFQDIYDLVEWIFRDTSEQLLATEHCAGDWKARLAVTAHYLRENEALVWNAMNGLNRVSLEKFLKAELYPIIKDVVDEKIGGRPILQEDREFIINVYVIGAIGLFFYWMDMGMESDYEMEINKLICLLDGSIEHLLTKFSGQSPLGSLEN